jgi:nucleotide-binding universal stress UspA family protein
MKRIIVGFDLTEIDEVLVAYLSFLANYWQFEEIYILHVTDSLTDGLEERQKVWQTNLPIDEFLKNKLQSFCFKHFPQALAEKIEYIISVGKPHEEMLRWAAEKETDLIVVGRKLTLAGSGMTPQKFALNSPCSVLLVPENVEKNLDTVLVSSDFSMYSRKATEIAIDLVDKVCYASLYCQYIFEPTTSDEKHSFYETNVAKKQAEIEYENFIREIDTKTVSVIPLLAKGAEEDDFVRTYQNAKDIDASLIIVGSKGRTFINNIFDKSFSQGLITYNNKIPLLIVKM